MPDLKEKDYWRMLTLYGLNTATYKIALGRCLWTFAESGMTEVSMGKR